MNAASVRVVSMLVAWLAFWSANAVAQQCFVVRGAPNPGNAPGDVPQIVRMTDAGLDALGGSPHAYVEVTRETPKEEFVRLMEVIQQPDGRRGRETTFSFSREGLYTLRGYRRDTFSWPSPAWPATRDPNDASHPIALACEPLEVKVPPIVKRADFTGTRGQWWVAYRAGSGAEGGASVFFGRFGLAGLAEVSLSRTIGERDPGDINRVVPGAEIRWRGARGYLGGGVRYFGDREPDRDRFRFAFVGGQELPSFRGRPVWMLLDIRVEDVRKNFIKGLRPGFGMRIDLWGSRE
jgi:hypothetical protein